MDILWLSQQLRRSGWSLFVVFRVFVVFVGHWGGTLVAFTALVRFMGLNVSCGVDCVFIINGVLGMDAC